MITFQARLTGLRATVFGSQLAYQTARNVILRRYQSTLIGRDSLPRILQPSMWESIIPSSLRRKTKEVFTERKKGPPNPASYFIWIYLLIGSQAIRIITVKNDHATFSRKAELQIDKLREVIRKLQAGEEVDVEKVLGTGVPEEEDAWEQALREIEDEERIWSKSRAQKREEKAARDRQREQEAKEREDASPVNVVAANVDNSKPPFTSPGFY